MIDVDEVVAAFEQGFVVVDAADSVVWRSAGTGFEVGEALHEGPHGPLLVELVAAVRQGSVREVSRFPGLGQVTARPWRAPGHVALCIEFGEHGVTVQSLEVALRASRMGLWRWTAATGEVTWDARMHEITGEPRPLTLGEWVDHMTHPEDRARVRAAGLQFPEPGPVSPSVSRIVRRSDGATLWVMSISTVYAGPDGQPSEWVGGVLDVSEQYQLQAELGEARRLESVAHLTTGVAHHVNNMLMVVDPCLRMLAEVAEHDMAEVVSDAIESCERAAGVVRHLMAFGRGGMMESHAEHAARDLLERVARAQRARLAADVVFESSCESRSTVLGAGGAVEHVLLSVLSNAVQAARDGDGSPWVRLAASDTSHLGQSVVAFEVEDSGPGIPDDLAASIYEPFFTTKGARGSGLGLASSRAIVHDLGGAIRHEPRAEGGTRFLITLPASGAAPDLAPPEEAPSQPALMRVLLIDDERSILRVIARGLPRKGRFEVVTAATVEEVGEVLVDRLFDVVLLDRSLGGFDGRDLVATLREHLPEARILFFTGQPLGQEEQGLVDGAVYKPLSMAELARRLRENA